ncbi:ROK family protein [Marinobacter sp. M216]|uniref:ROK family protein n=1 Tax=Marinobacter albus TaxID=3030833 RepID=A0ABT7HAN5_9GAMM|nr:MULTISPECIES: ROK family protein [unclassified Marinobacter]MBW7470294.1 ROK family protein [Marinobacter sp. F4218]MDK9557441.1 ROK family protein [Marinobacter sp. M216]
MNNNWLIGVDLGGTKTEVILMDRQSKEHFRNRVPTPADDYSATLETIRVLVQEAEAQAGSTAIPVGMGIPGSVSGITGCIKNSNSTWLNGQPMQEHLCNLLQRPVTLTNDANCLALSEATDGAGKSHHTVFAAILGTGCGAGISVNGQILTGPNGVAGEWGHNPLAWTSQAELEQRPCFCGRRGCNETFVSGTGLSLTHRLITGKHQPARNLVDQAHNGDHQACETMNQYLEHLARGLAAVINVLDPGIIVLGGGMSNAEPIYEDLPGRLSKYVFGGECTTPIKRAVHGDSSGVRGAAWLGGENLS